MKSRLAAIATALITSVLITRADDSMYPPAPAAKPVVDIDGTGFIINGRRTFVSSGSVHYARVPHELWLDRLMRVKNGAFNCVETYAFWNFQEPRENEFDFTGDKDFGGFLAAAQKVGLYAITRVGPYVCAEWDFGGYPIWIKFKPDFPLRTENPAFLALNDHWYDKILPIVAQHQIHRGGNVIMVQLENEHPRGWGVVHSAYFDHLNEKAVKLGVEVPHFMSGLNHGAEPTPRDPNTSQRKTPWFSTEFWSGWFNLYGALNPGKLASVERHQWGIMARGGAGYNFYMLHGGSNFDTWNDPSGAASYDYGGAIGQAGDLRPVYYRMKRANQLAQSFPDVVGNGADASSAPEYQNFVTGAKLAGVRKSPAGTIAFIVNESGHDVTANLAAGTPLHLKGNQTVPLLRDVAIAEGVKIVDSNLPVLGITRNESTLTLVVYGQPEDKGRLTLSAAGGMRMASSSKAFTTDLTSPVHLQVGITIPRVGPEECILQGTRLSLRIVAVSNDLGLYTWLLGALGKQYVVCGPAFVTGINEVQGKPFLIIERPYSTPSCGQVAVYGAIGQSWHLGVKAHPGLDTEPAPALTPWQMAVSPEISPRFDDSKWKSSDNPVQMGADGDTSAFAWYRSTVDSPFSGTGTLHFTGRDHLLVFVNGQPIKTSHKEGDHWEAGGSFISGRNSISVFTSHSGRDKAYNYLGAVANRDNKGIYGAVSLSMNGQTRNLTGWRLKGGILPYSAGLRWGGVADAHGSPCLYRTSFLAHPPAPTGAHPILRAEFKTLTRGTMWFNGHNLGRYPETIPISSIYLPECWLKEGPNELTILDESGANPSQVKLAVETAASRELIPVSELIDPSTPIAVPE